jgi:group II intron reverse transcriptase/maturase
MNTESAKSVSTKQRRIAQLAEYYAQEGLTTLGHYLDMEWMKEAYRRVRKGSAPGVDGQSVAEYGRDLEGNLGRLMDRVKSGKYEAPPVKRVYIEKADGKEKRPIGMPTVEDKILQRAVVMLLEPIYEREFHDFSYGFRPGRSAHQALEAIWQGINRTQTGWIVDVDIRAFFDTLEHEKLLEILQRRVKDGMVLRLVGKWLKAGVMEAGALSYPESGTPQGGVISPLLSNIYLHEVLDEWFEQAVQPRLQGRGFLVRYADDFVMGFECREDAERVMKALPGRFGRYGLKIHEGKTRLVRFGRPDAKQGGRGSDGEGGNRGEKPETFDFLGFTHYWTKSRKGNWVVHRKTARKRLKRALKVLNQWCRKQRHRSLGDLMRELGLKLRGHYAYYGIRCNYRSLAEYYHEATRRMQKWLNRRSRKEDAMSWERFRRLMTTVYPLPLPRIVHAGQ